MKMYLGNTPLKSMKVGTNTDDATFVASDLQAGKTGYSMGRKVIGTGKSFEFASYGGLRTNAAQYIPTDINVIEVASTTNPVQLNFIFSEMKDVDFTVSQNIGNVTIDGVVYPLTAQAANNFLTVTCEKTITLQAFYGKDNYA